MALAEDFDALLATLPPDWTDLEFDLRVFDEERYVEAATLLTQVNAQGYSKHDWHWRVLVARDFGHAAAAEVARATLALLDGEGIAGELRLREARSGRVEAVYDWGLPESMRREFQSRRAQA